MNKIRVKLFFVFMLGVLTFPLLSFSESEITIQSEEISFEVIPSNPEPYQSVTVMLYSYAADLDRAIITWQNNTGVVLSGIGKKTHSFVAPGPDESIYFDIVINPTEQSGTLRKRIIITPSEIDLMWESVDSYTPPFYKGRSLPSRGGTIKVVAIPNSNTITSGIGSIDYTWKNNKETDLGASGYNKNVYIFKNSLFEKFSNIEVQASSVSGNYNAQKNIQIPTYSPQLIFYKKSPTEGLLFNNGISGDYLMTEDQATFLAAPYNLANKEKDFLFTYKWSVNSNPISTPSKKNEISIRPEEKGGYANISLVIENLNELYQKVTNSFKIIL